MSAARVALVRYFDKHGPAGWVQPKSISARTPYLCKCGQPYAAGGLESFSNHLVADFTDLLAGCVTCDDCGGLGDDLCDRCDGTGKRGRGKCSHCTGRGYVDCPSCGGVGVVTREDALSRGWPA